jgi:hypothetical protein
VTLPDRNLVQVLKIDKLDLLDKMDGWLEFFLFINKVKSNQLIRLLLLHPTRRKKKTTQGDRIRHP